MTSLCHDLSRALTSGHIPDSTRADVPAFWEAAREEGLLPLLVHRLGGSTAAPPEVRRAACDSEAHAALADRDLHAVLAEFDRRHLRVLVIKGAALAQTLYERPGLRPRVDTDLLICRDDVDRAHAVFRDRGARYVPHVTGEYVMSQFHYVRTDDAGCAHAYDVHWRVVNPPTFATAFDFEALWSRAVPLPALGASARTVSLPDALLVACVHRAAHHGASGPLLWLLDVHRLADALDAGARAAFLEMARTGRVAAVASHALAEAAALFGGAAAQSLGDDLRKDAARAAEPSAVYLESRTRLGETLGDVRTMSWGGRARFLRELAFPPAGYMRAVYGTAHRGPLPALYLRRITSGLVRWARRRR